MADSETKGSPSAVWMRGLIMLVFIVLLSVGQSLMGLLAIIQFLWLLLSGHPNPNLRSFGRSLSKWMAQVGRFQCVDTEDRPFPWAEWPAAD